MISHNIAYKDWIILQVILNSIQLVFVYIAKKELASTNQNPRIEWRRFAPPLDSWVAKLSLL